MALLPKVRLKTLVAFPATVTDGVGVDVVKENGNYSFDLDFSDFAPPVAGVTDPANQNVLAWNAVTGAYALMPISLFGVGPGVVTEAPVNGTQYGRQNAGWTPIPPSAPAVHTHTASQITDFAEATDDRVAALLVPGANVTLTYNDAANTLTVAASGSGGGGGGGTALDTTFTPVGNISAGNVQAAIAELDTEKVAKTGDTMTGALFVRPPSGTAVIHLDALAAAQQAVVQAYQSGVVKWQFGKASDDNFFVFDNAAASTALYIPTGGTTVNFVKKLQVDNVTASTSTTTGALTVQAGGAGIAGALHVGGKIYGGPNAGGTEPTNVTALFSTTAGPSLAVPSGLHYFNVNADNSYGAFLSFYWLAGDGSTGIGIGTRQGGTNTDLLLAKYGPTVSPLGKVEIIPTTASTSSTTGALTVAGGAGIAKSLAVGQYIQTTAPVVRVGNFTVADNENYFICNVAATITVTLPPAASFVGRAIWFKTIQAQTVVSASANVCPSGSLTAGTAILPATIGAWAMLVSDGGSWQTMAAK